MGGQDTEGDGKISSKELKGGEGFRSYVILATEPRLKALPDQGCNNTTS